MTSTRAALAFGLSVGMAVASVNPFQGKGYYVNPHFSELFEQSIKTASPAEMDNLKLMQSSPSAIWLNAKKTFQGKGPGSLEGILKDASSKSPPQMVVFVLYNLPNRNCNANVSFGEICCKRNSDGACNWDEEEDCKAGLEEYKHFYVDPIVAKLKEFDGKVPLAVVVEPDSLATIATDPKSDRCNNTATRDSYSGGITYAVEQLVTEVPSAAIYLDAAHGGVLGWENNLNSYMKWLTGMKLPFAKIRGFATNVGSYQPVGVQCAWCPDAPAKNNFCLQGRHPDHECCADPCGVLPEYNFGNNELNYAAGLVTAAKNWLNMEAHVIIDTSRNGVADMRKTCSTWCNPSGAGAGIRPTTQTANTSVVDAYFWLKTPGLSDGCNKTLPDGKPDPSCDSNCGSKDSKTGAPQAGKWFDAQAKELAAKADFKAKPAAAKLAACPVEPPPGQEEDYKYVSDKGEKTCGGAYKQCGGDYWHGPSCCGGKCKCMKKKHKKWTSWMCQPPKGEWECGKKAEDDDTDLDVTRLYTDATASPDVGAGRLSLPIVAATAVPATLALLAAAGWLRGGRQHDRRADAGAYREVAAPAPPAQAAAA